MTEGITFRTRVHFRRGARGCASNFTWATSQPRRTGRTQRRKLMKAPYTVSEATLIELMRRIVVTVQPRKVILEPIPKRILIIDEDLKNSAVKRWATSFLGWALSNASAWRRWVFRSLCSPDTRRRRGPSGMGIRARCTWGKPAVRNASCSG